jgi:hypothetical protein
VAGHNATRYTFHYFCLVVGGGGGGGGGVEGNPCVSPGGAGFVFTLDMCAPEIARNEIHHTQKTDEKT